MAVTLPSEARENDQQKNEARVELTSRVVPFDNGFVKLNHDRLRFPDGREGERAWLEHRARYGCLVAPLLPNGDLVFVEVYRHPIGQWSLELPGGLSEPGETPDDTARRELREETGLSTATLTKVGSTHPDPGIARLRVDLYRAEHCDGWNEEHVHPADQIRRVRRIPRQEVPSLALHGKIVASLTMTALYIAVFGANAEG